MKLDDEQLARFDELGYLFIPDCFTPAETELLRRASSDVLATQREEVWREKDGTPRMAFACHQYSEACRLLAHDPRLVDPLEQLFGEPTYIHQFKINAKAAFTGDVWQWHQDFPTWHADDGMPEPRAMNIAVFLDDVNEFNGPLLFIPGSHRGGAIDAGHDLTTTSYPLWTLDNATVEKLVSQGGIVAPKGPAGSMLMFHSCLVHGSPSNMSPWNRNICYLSLCAVSNHIRRFKRPDYIAHRDFTPIEPLSDDCLTNPSVRITDLPLAQAA